VGVRFENPPPSAPSPARGEGNSLEKFSSNYSIFKFTSFSPAESYNISMKQVKSILNPKRMKVGMISLGCPKTLVDSEIILGALDSGKYEVIGQVGRCDIALINTCAFIHDAKQESIDRILDLIKLKQTGKVKFIVVVGCLPQRYPKVMKKEFREIDAFVGTGDYHLINEVLEQAMTRQKGDRHMTQRKRLPVPFFRNQNPALLEMVPGMHITRSPGYIYNSTMKRVSLTSPFSRYIKISEGCSHQCSFCTIPSYRGKYRSRFIDDILREAAQLVEEGARELILTGQDTTYFGYDTHHKLLLQDLLHDLNQIPRLRWIRVMYAYPSYVNDSLIEAIAKLEKVCHYIDIPVQHISDTVLRRMKRTTTKKSILKLIEKLRKRIPDIAIRTSLIVGFPGETEKDFRELLRFASEVRFERLGIFTYSREEGTSAALMKNQVPEKVKKERYREGMVLQQKVSREKNRRLKGRTMEVLIEDDFRYRFQKCQVLTQVNQNPALLETVPGTGAWYTGRSYMDAPEIDGIFRVKVPRQVKLYPGEFVRAKVTDYQEYDLTGDFEKVV